MSILSAYAGYFVLTFLSYRFVKSYIDSRNSPLSKIPTVGYSQEIIREGYRKYNGHAFKIPMVNHWHVIVSGPKLVEDIKRAPDDYLSLRFAADNALQAHWQIGNYKHEPDFYRINAIRNKITRDIVPHFQDVRDEIQAAFADEIPVKGDEWVPVRVIETARRVVSRTSNRLFVGLPLCRDPDYRDLNIEFTVDLVIGSNILQLFPDFMKPMVSKLVSNIPKQMRRGSRLLGPLIEERLKKEAEYGKDWEGKPTDLISWLIDATPAHERTIDNISLQILVINFGAIHTTGIAFTSTFYYLAAHPELHGPLREEIENAVGADGWTKSSVAKMHKLDSVLKEAQRLAGNGVTAMNRLALKDFTFSDGTTVPAGTFMSAASNATHNDENIYPNANEFRGFRFADRKSEEGEEAGQNMVKPNVEYMIFGNGKHAWYVFPFIPRIGPL
ncbi:cytochrome P450 [Marasmius fiardii PR-910]|nr:cytochrome P450 [Marasmius fiardii PR-910]